MSIENDRWFKLKLDNFIMSAGNSGHRYKDATYNMYGKTYKQVKWYEHNFLWSQIADELSKGTKYSAEEVEEYLKARVAMAKMEAILDGH